MTESATDGQTDNQNLETPDNMDDKEPSAAEQPKFVTRKEKRKALKKEKRKQIRKEVAEKARADEEARLNDPEEQRKIQLDEEREKERLERERKEFEERERIFLEELQRKKKEEEEQEREHDVTRESNLKQDGAEEGSNEDGEWEYVEEGPPEIIWQGNEIIVKKNKVRVKKKDINQDKDKEDPNRPTSNPLPPQSEAYAAYKNAPMTSAELLDTVAQQVPNFGTEQDKAHCPFHIKTGACRFGLRCNRVHYYPDKSNTLLIKNMYNGPGLAWEQDEGLEVIYRTARIHWRQTRATQTYTDEEVERSYEDFYEDVHTEFLKFGEIINFKVCRNGSFHLRGNVYVHYKSLDSAVMAYNSVHGRYFAGKQVKCEFVSVTKWKVAICGEYMKSRLKTCSRGSACNFLHCFSNPGGDYEWADCDKPPPRYWMKTMTALFGYSDESWHDTSPKTQQHSSRVFTSDRDSYHNRRHLSMETNQHNGSSSRSHHEKNYARKSRHHERQEADKYENDSRRRSKSRDLYGRNRTPTPYNSSDDEDLYSEKRYVYMKRSRHRKDISESSNDDEESNDVKRESSETRKEDKTRSSRHPQRSRRHDREESEKFSKRRKRKPARDRSKSRDCVPFSEKNEMIDRWEPDSSLVEDGDEDGINVGVKKDNEISDDGKMKERILCSGGVEEESSGIGNDSERKRRHSRDRDGRTREKRKRI